MNELMIDAGLDTNDIQLKVEILVLQAILR